MDSSRQNKSNDSNDEAKNIIEKKRIFLEPDLKKINKDRAKYEIEKSNLRDKFKLLDEWSPLKKSKPFDFEF